MKNCDHKFIDSKTCLKCGVSAAELSRKLPKTTVRASNSYDRMSIDAKFPTGGVFKFSVTRSGERLVLGGSNDPVIAKQQQKVVAAWLEYRKDESNGQRHERVKEMVQSCNSVGDLCAKIQAEAVAAK